MATVRNLACIAFRPEALDVHGITHKTFKSGSLTEKNQASQILTSDSNLVLSYLITTVLLNFINHHLVFKTN